VSYTIQVWNPAGAGKRFVEVAVPGHCHVGGVQHQACVLAAPGVWRWEAIDLPAGFSTFTATATAPIESAAAAAIPAPSTLTILADLLVPGGAMDLSFLHGDQVVAWDLAGAKVLNHSAIRSVVRIPATTVGGLGIWLDLEYIPDLRGSTPFRLWITAAPWNNTPFSHAGSLGLRTRGAVYPVFSHAARKGLGYQQIGEQVTVPLLPAARWGRGQGQIYHGHLVYGIEAAGWVAQELQGHGGAVIGARCLEMTELPDGGAGGEPTLGQVTAWSLAARNAAKTLRGKPWSSPEPLGLRVTPGATGDQADFGDATLWFTQALLTDPDLIQECVSQQYCRPEWMLEQDRITPVRAAKHPEWKTWDWQTHRAGHSVDRLGCGQKDIAEWDMLGGHWGHDEEHAQPNTMIGYATLTAKPWAIELVDRWCEPFLASVRNYNPRAQGRTLYSLGRINRLLRRDDVAAVIVDRLSKQPRFRPAVVGGPYPLGLIGPDGRNLDVTQWLPWWDGLGIAGMSIHNPTWLYDSAAPWLLWGWRPRVSNPNGRLEVLKAIAWNNGVPLSDVEYTQIKSHGPGAVAETENSTAWVGDRFVGTLLEAAPIAEAPPAAGVALVEESDGTAFSEWCLTAVRWVLREATKRGDDVIRDRAALIVQQHGGGSTVAQQRWRQLWRP
jgi:hypothetical protein